MFVNTRNGLFANAGYGGGTFNGNTAFGAYSEDDMRQHHYGDVSNLNAPYDNMSVQGLGDSGGVFAADLEAAAADGGAPLLPPSAYPWLQESEATLIVQKDVNARIKASGKAYLSIQEDGKLGPKTCQALSNNFMLDQVSGACDAYRSQWENLANTPSGPVTVSNDVTPVDSGLPSWVWAALAGTAAVGVAIYLKRKKRSR